MPVNAGGKIESFTPSTIIAIATTSNRTKRILFIVLNFDLEEFVPLHAYLYQVNYQG